MLLSAFKKRSSDSFSVSRTLAQVWQANQQASSNYVPKPYSGKVTDFRPARQYRALNKPDLKWDRLARGGQRVVVVPGYPAVMLQEPYVANLAAKLATCLDEAIRGSAARRSEEMVETTGRLRA
jgi:thioesterase domain-containing protein